MLSDNDSVLVIIDVQDRLLNAVFNKQSLEKKALIMTKTASILSIPIVVTEQYPKGLGATIKPIQDCFNRNTSIFEKTSFSVVENVEILNKLRELNRRQIVLFGIETHICVNQTAISLREMGCDVNVISDACGSRSESEYKAGLERMKEHGIHILTAEIAVFEWLRTSRHPNFKDVQALIK